jgi:hypothetical protein
MQLALKRRVLKVRAQGAQTGATELRDEELEKASKLVAEQAEWITALEDDNSTLQSW